MASFSTSSRTSSLPPPSSSPPASTTAPLPRQFVRATQSSHILASQSSKWLMKSLRIGSILGHVVLRFLLSHAKVTANLALGFVRDIGADKVEFKFKKHKYIEIVGSYSFECITKPDVNVDVFIRLPKVWARQRNSIYAHDSLNGYLISVILAYLATESGGRHIKNSMNTIQIFRIALDFMAAAKLRAGRLSTGELDK